MYSRSRDPYDHLHSAMIYFHSLLRAKWADISASLAKPSPNIPYVASAIVDFCQHLDMHHAIEEARIFPVLAKRLPQFRKSGEHTAEHEVMHRALGDLQGYAAYVVDDPEAWKIDKAKALCARLEKALFPHLAAEEESIKGSSLKAAGFTPAEVARIAI
jgi:hemerythrin-like domain-containing protein